MFRVRQVKHLVSVSYACQLGGEDFVSDLHRASGSYNVKLQSSVSKSLLLKKKKKKKKRAATGKGREWEPHMEQVLHCVMSKQKLT